MGSQKLSGDITKSWRFRKFEVKKIGEEPPINTEGFWKKPKHNDVRSQYYKNMKQPSRR